MFVKKFEADSLDEALKAIKGELGPDAIILKTITNKGLKGAFKRKKIEITAAISEKNFKDKSVVDYALGENKEEFYRSDSGHISNMIGRYNKTNPKGQTFVDNTYGKVGLNKTVKQRKNSSNSEKSKVISSDLDAFLNTSSPSASASASKEKSISHSDLQMNTRTQDPALREEGPTILTKDHLAMNNHASSIDYSQQLNEIEKLKSQNNDLIRNQEIKIESLEKRLIDLSKIIEHNQKDPEGVYQLKNILKSYNINNSFINKLIKNTLFEFSDSDLENSDLLVDFALREMNKVINTKLPSFSSLESKNKSNIVVLLSEVSVGQSALAQKIVSTNENFKIIKNHGEKTNFTEKILDINIEKVESLGAIISSTRKVVEEGQNVIIDYRSSKDNNETKNFINSLKRSFNNVEVILTTSAIHSEEYNKSIINKHRTLIDGLSINFLDLCLNYGSLFNLSYEFETLPFYFYGTGDVIPRDFESSSSERILSGILNLE